MWNPNSMMVDSQEEEDESWEVKAFAEDTGNVMGTTWPPRSYTCTYCRREFRSAQALGGHMNVHRRDRARLHQAQPNLRNPNSLINPSEELVADGGLCLLFSLTKPNAIFKPSSLNIVNESPSHFHSFKPHSDTGKFTNYPAVESHHSLSYSLPRSSKNEASTSTDHKSNQSVVSLDDMIKKTASVSMAFSSTASFPSFCRLPKVSSSSLPFNPSASLSSRSLPSRVNLNLRISVRAVSTQAAPASGGIAPAIALTDTALKHLNKMRSEKNEDLCLRIGVKQGGCSGMSYSMEFESKENTRPDDTVMEYDGFVIVCDPKSLLFIFGMQLDFSDALIGGGFSFKNPNATQTCGCGKSFAAEM